MPPTAEVNWLMIARVQLETHDVTTLVAETARGGEIPSFLPGQYCLLSALGAGEIPISISGNPERRDRLTFTIRASGAASSALAARRPGEPVLMRGPFGDGWPLAQAQGSDVLLIGGGMGLAALRPVIYTIAQNRANFGRLTILCGARTPADLIYTPQLAAWDGLARTTVLTTVDLPSAGWNGHVGLVTGLLDRIALHESNTVAMLCGPDSMLSSTAANLESRGIPAHKIFLSTSNGIIEWERNAAPTTAEPPAPSHRHTIPRMPLALPPTPLSQLLQ
jgi:anaerobic sulfite reductase subunit B